MARKKENKNNLAEFVSSEEELESDPFAVDFFSQSSYAASEEDSDELANNAESFEESNFIVERPWNADLPQAAISEINQNLSLLRLPHDLAETACKISADNISQVVLQNSAAAHCEIISTFETDYAEETSSLEQEKSVCLNFVLEPHQAEAAIILDAVFAIKIIETALSSKIAASERRALSKTELVVLEFLALNCLKDINSFFAEPLFRWRTVEQAQISSVLTRGLLSNIRIQIGGIVGIAKILLPFDFLQNLSQANNPLLTSHEKSENVAQFSKIVSGVRFHAVLGETIIDAREMTILERGDVIFIERPFVNFANSTLTGSVQIRIGDETSESLYGDLSTTDKLRFELREVNQRNENELLRSIMPEYQAEDQSLDSTSNQTENLLPDDVEDGESNKGVLALEKVIVKIAVELTSRRISLNELASMNVGQIIELGSRATDPVELVTDGRTIAIGELIDVEGNLAIRLTRVLL